MVGNHTANYRGCAKWKEVKATLARRAVTKASYSGAAAGPSAMAKTARPVPFAEQQSLGSGWSHVVRGRVFKAAPTPKPEPLPKPVTTPPTEDKVFGPVKGDENKKLAPKAKTPKRAPANGASIRPTLPIARLRPSNPISLPSRKSLISSITSPLMRVWS